MPNIDPHLTRRGMLLASAACVLPSGLPRQSLGELRHPVAVAAE